MEPNRSWWLVREGLRKIGVFMLAVLVGFVILILVLIPFAWAIWQLLLYAAKQ